MSSKDDVSVGVGLWLMAPGRAVWLAGSLRYSWGDPYAIRIVIHVGMSRPVEWVLARELLRKGMEGREGLGDVQVWPTADFPGGMPGPVLNIELSSPSGQALIQVPLCEVS